MRRGAPFAVAIVLLALLPRDVDQAEVGAHGGGRFGVCGGLIGIRDAIAQPLRDKQKFHVKAAGYAGALNRPQPRWMVQLQMIENFFGLVNDQVVTMPGPEYMTSLDFETLISSIESTKEMLSHTAPIMSQLDSFSIGQSTAPPRPSFASERR